MFKFCDGFDHYAADGTTGTTIQTYLEAAGYTVRNALATTFSIVAGRRSGAHALAFTVAANSTTNASISWSFTNSSTYACFGFAMYATGSRMRICRIENVLDLEWDTTTGKVKVGSNLGATPLILSAWYYFEVEIDSSAKTAKIWANNELQLTVDLSAVTIPSVLTITWGQSGTIANAGVQWLDDFYVIDGSGSRNNARLQPIEITTRAPSADVTKEWYIVNSAKANHWEIVSQLSPAASGAPYLQSNVAGATDMYRSNAALPTSNTIFAVSVLAFARKGDLDNRSIGLAVQVDGGSINETQLALTETFKYYQATHEVVPGGGAWTQNIVESLNFGIITR